MGLLQLVRVLAGVSMVAVMAEAQPMPGGVCRPVEERRQEVGCWIMRHVPVTTRDSMVWWYLDAFPDSAAAARASTPTSTVMPSQGRWWRYTLADAQGPAADGDRVARVGPLPLKPGTRYMAQYMDATFTPGMATTAHRHSGIEAVVTLDGETCMETPTWVKVGRRGAPPIVAPPGTSMLVRATGVKPRRALVLILHAADAPASSPSVEWTPERRCEPAPAPALPELRFAPVQQRSRFTGDRWSYMEAGAATAPPIVLLHGIGGNSISWRWQLSGLADHFRVIAWNAPGYMLSDALATPSPTCADYADAFVDFIDALQLPRVGIMANSFGSRVATCVALRHPRRVSRIMMVGPSAGRDSITPQERDSVLAFRRAQVAAGGFHFPENRMSALIATGTPDSLLAVLQREMQANNPAAFMQAAQFIVQTDNGPRTIASRLRTPIPLLLVVGREDRVSPLALNGARLHAAWPGARLDVLDGIGHLPQNEAPSYINRLAREFFRETPP